MFDDDEVLSYQEQMKQTIIAEFLGYISCKGKDPSRDEFQKISQLSGVRLIIDHLWGSWTKFVQEIHGLIHQLQGINAETTTNSETIVVTSLIEGTTVNEECLDTLISYAKHNKGKLFILPLLSPKTKGTVLDPTVSDKLTPYIYKQVICEKDKNCIIKSYSNLKIKQLDPFTNLDKAYDPNISHIILGSPRQHMKILSYGPGALPRQAWSTGTISNYEYQDDIKGSLLNKSHIFGGLVLTYNKDKGYYQVRNLTFKDGVIYDLNKKYDAKGKCTPCTASAVVLGDLHCPEEDQEAIEETIKLITKVGAKEVFLHDWCSMNSINHHIIEKPLTRAIAEDENNITLQTELSISREKVDNLLDRIPDQSVRLKIVESNHLDFLPKYYDSAASREDSKNYLFAFCLGGRYGELIMKNKLNPDNPEIFNLFTVHWEGDGLYQMKHADRIDLLNADQEYNVSGFELSQHGHKGLNGAKGNIQTHIKTFSNSVTGHSHSPQINNGAFVVGTLSKLHLSYTAYPSTWAQSNVVIYPNQTAQQILLS